MADKWRHFLCHKIISFHSTLLLLIDLINLVKLRAFDIAPDITHLLLHTAVAPLSFKRQSIIGRYASSASISLQCPVSISMTQTIKHFKSHFSMLHLTYYYHDIFISTRRFTFCLRDAEYQNTVDILFSIDRGGTLIYLRVERMISTANWV